MAYVTQMMKKAKAPKIKTILKKYGVKGSLAVRHHSTLVLNLKSGVIDFIANSNQVCGNDTYQVSRGFQKNTSGYCNVNPYWFKEHYDGEAKEFLAEILEVMNEGNHDNSDIMTDYFDVGWYVDINIGKWNKPYVVEA